MDVLAMGKGGVGTGPTPDGQPAHIRWAPPGGRVAVLPFGRKKGIWQGRRTELLRKPPGYTEPRCSLFALCGGCALQELDLPTQRQVKQQFALAQLGDLEGVQIQPVRGADEAYSYRNKVEFSFGSARYLSEAAHAAEETIEGRWLGFHAPGRWDRIVDAERCDLVSEAANAVLAEARRLTLTDSSPPPWNPRSHTGFWRHLVLRQGFATDQLLAIVYTNEPADSEADAVHELAKALMALELPDSVSLVGVVWGTNAQVADVARGTTQQIWGRGTLTEKLGPVTFELSPTSFFQTSTTGAVVLYDAIGEALGDAKGTCYDLYCGIGTIGQYLAHRFDRIVGVEERPESIEDAKRNAAANGLTDVEYTASRMEKALHLLPASQEAAGDTVLVVDPPRAGLHPKAATALAGARADVLIYVACNPASLGRDRVVLEAGGWTLKAVWTVDLFPQTGHIELIGRFEREPVG